MPAPSAYKIEVSGSSSAAATAGSSVNLTVTALDSTGAALIGLYQDESLSFYGLLNSPSNNVPTVKDKSGTAQTVTASAGTPNTTLTFTNGVATVIGANNGVLKAYNGTGAAATLNCSDGTATSASGTGAAGLSLTVNPVAANRLVFTTAAQNIPVNTTSGTMTVQRQDQFGNPNTADADVTVNLSSDSGTGVFRDTGDTTTITSVTISTGSSTASFKYKDSTPNSPTLTAADAAVVLAPATQLGAIVELTWSATPATYNWNTSDANWTGAGSVYADGNGVTFNDSGSATSPINLVGTLSPTSVAVNTSSKNYTFSGSGYISGTATLAKTGTATLTIATANDYSGATTIFGGVVDVQNNTALGGTAGTTTVSSGAAVQVDGNGLTISEPITLNGSGLASGGGLRHLANANTVSGAITLASDSRINSDAGTLTLSGSTISGATNLTVGGAGNVTIADDITTTGKLTKDGSGTLALGGNNTYSGNTTVSAGVLSLASAATVQNSPTIILNGGDLLGNGTFTIANNIGIGAASGSTGTNALLDAASGQAFSVSGVVASAGNTGANSLIVNSGVGNNGTVVLGGANTFTGSTVISNGNLQVANSLALQKCTVNYNNQGGILVFDSSISAATLGGLTGTQNLGLTNLASGAVDLTVGSNNVSTTYSGSMTGTGSLTKMGTGTLTLTGINSYTGTTTGNGGTLELTNNGVINGGALSGAGFVVDGGSLTAGGTSTFSALVNAFSQSSGTVSVNAFNANANDGTLFQITGGSFSASSLTLPRTVSFATAPTATAPIAGATTSGLYINGAGATVSLGTLSIATGNSSASVRLDAGSVVATNEVLVSKISGGSARWGILQVNGGSFTSSDTVNGIVIAENNGAACNGEVYLSGGTTTAELIAFGTSADTVGGNGFLIINNGASLYLGSGGIVKPNTSGSYTSTVSLLNGVLGAKADWSSTNAMQLSGSSFTIKAADASNTPHNIALGGVLSGGGALTKTGNGTLTLGAANTYGGTTTISAGTLALTNDGVNAFGSISSSLITVASNATFDVSQAVGYTLGSGKTLAGVGTVVGAFTAGAAANISPAGAGAQGTLTFSNGLSVTGANIKMDLTSDPTGTITSNDFINVTGDVTVSGINNIVATPVGGSLGLGTYMLIKYTGNFYGDLTNLVCGIGTVSTNTPGQIDLVVSSPRPLTSLVWRGDGSANLWDTGASSNWFNGASLDRFYTGDTNSFDDSATNFLVTLPAPLLPAATSAVLVNATNDYTFAGSGYISGGTGLTKTNSGRLTMSIVNDYTGVTTLSGGILSIATLANGGVASPIGAASTNSANLVINGGTLEYRGGNLSVDRGATLGSSGGTISVTNAIRTLTISGTLTGPGALAKSGSGALALTVPNTYGGGTVVSNGTLVLGSNSANNDGAGGSALGATNNSVTFYGGTLQLFGYGGSTGNNYSTLYNPLVVPSGQTGTLQMWSRGPSNSGSNSGLKSSLTGGGTLNLVVNYIRDNLDGNWSAFTGLINVTPKPSGNGDEMRINNSFGYSNAVIFLNDGVQMNYQVGANATVDIGELGGTSAASVGTGSLSPANTTWRVGWKNTSSTFAGTIANDAAITKVGTGSWTLTGANTYTGPTTVSNGTLLVNGSLASGSTVTVNGGTLGGTGTINGATTVDAGALLAAGSGGIGTLTFNNNLTLNAASTNNFAVTTSGGASNLVAVAGTLAPNGSVIHVTSGTALGAGTYTLFTYGSTSGTVFNATPVFDVAPAASAAIVDTGSGQINLVINAAAPSFSGITTSGSDITLNATGGSASGSVTVLSSTNLALPLAQWTTVTTGSFDVFGNYSHTITGALSSGQPQQFYILQMP